MSKPTVPLTLKCALLFLALSVFSWGLQAKLSVYNSNSGNSTSTIYRSKLSTEKASVPTAAPEKSEQDDRDQTTFRSVHFTVFAVLLHGAQVSAAFMIQPVHWSPKSDRYSLHDLLRRPPPVLS